MTMLSSGDVRERPRASRRPALRAGRRLGTETTAWVGVASRSHVRSAVEGGFCQVNHGREAPLRRMATGDRILYYSPRESMNGGTPIRAFTAIGEITDDAPYQAEGSDDFRPFRRSVRYWAADQAPIHPMLDALSFTRGRASWGQVLRRGLFGIAEDDFRLIAAAMGARPTE